MVALRAAILTFDRPAALRRSLMVLADQTLTPVHCLVVDNAPEVPGAVDVVRELSTDLPFPLDYVAAPHNLGPAGGFAMAMELQSRSADDTEWVLLVDDDDPPFYRDELEVLARAARRALDSSPRVASVGRSGSGFDVRKGRAVRVPDDRLASDLVPVSQIGSGQSVCINPVAIREIGTYDPRLFFGFEDLEFGLRARRAGYSLFASGELMTRRRRDRGSLGAAARPSIFLGQPSWRSYYSLRNLIWILRQVDAMAAMRVTLVVGVGKLGLNFFVRPNRAFRQLQLNFAACRDGWLGRLGQTMTPVAKVEGE